MPSSTSKDGGESQHDTQKIQIHSLQLSLSGVSYYGLKSYYYTIEYHSWRILFCFFELTKDMPPNSSYTTSHHFPCSKLKCNTVVKLMELTWLLIMGVSLLSIISLVSNWIWGLMSVTLMPHGKREGWKITTAVCGEICHAKQMWKKWERKTLMKR